jgi:hypothetical protein
LEQPGGAVHTPEFLRLILGTWLSVGLQETDLPDDFGLAAKLLNDLDFRILLHVHDRMPLWERLSLDGRWTRHFSGYHQREIGLSLAKLTALGFLTAGEGNDGAELTGREWQPEIADIDNFGHSLNLLPTIAVMPFSLFSSIRSMRESGDLERWLTSTSQPSLRILAHSMSAVRRHPYEGYQWNSVVPESLEGDRYRATKPRWVGTDRQFGTADEAIEAADAALSTVVRNLEWYRMSV